MSTVARTLNEQLLPKPVNGKTDPEQLSDVTHLKDSMPTRRHEEPEDRLEVALSAMAQAITAQATNRRPSAAAWAAAGVAAIALLISITGTRWTSAGESDLKRDIAVLAEKLIAAEERQKERERIADRERALIDERYRQMSIALESRGIKLPK